MDEKTLKWFMGGLSQEERSELVTLEYVLTWGYTYNFNTDKSRYKELSARSWKYREANPLNTKNPTQP